VACGDQKKVLAETASEPFAQPQANAKQRRSKIKRSKVVNECEPNAPLSEAFLLIFNGRWGPDVKELSPVQDGGRDRGISAASAQGAGAGRPGPPQQDQRPGEPSSIAFSSENGQKEAV